MNNLKVLLCFGLMLISTKNVSGAERGAEETIFSGSTCEILLAKLEAIESKLEAVQTKTTKDRNVFNKDLSNAINQFDQKFQRLNQNFSASQTETNLAMKEHREFIQQKMNEIANAITTSETKTSVVIKKEREVMEQNLARINRTLNHLGEATDTQFKAVLTQCNKTEETVIEKHEQLWQNIDMLTTKHDLSVAKINSGLYCQSTIITSCMQNPSKRSGKFLIQTTDKNETFMGYCDQIVFGGGWLVFQYRYDGSVDFYRNWAEYRDGFGSIHGEYWLGLEHLHQLTSARKHELLVELKGFDGSYLYARYDEFQIGSEEEQYKLKKLGAYSGTAGNSLDYHRGCLFSTKDRGNDFYEGFCSYFYHGAWWYNDSKCCDSNLNGPYLKDKDHFFVMFWNEQIHDLGLAYSRMSIREI